MTIQEYYALLKEKHEKTDWANLKSITEYNRYARELIHMVYAEREEKAE